MTTLEQNELIKFRKSSQEWSDINGEFKTLHKINPIRIDYILTKIKEHFNISNLSKGTYNNFTILDIGCGGGIASVTLAKHGINVTGIDANSTNIEAAAKYAN